MLSRKPLLSLRASRRQMRGVSLIEVLISILLSAIGLLALAGANVASIRYSKMSQYRGTATLLASDMAERMRANKAGLASYAYGSSFSVQATAATAVTTCDTYSSTCTTPADMAAYDLANWRLLVRSQLPEGSVFIRVPAATLSAPATADLWIAWRDPAVATPSENSADARNNANECPNALSVGGDLSIRCSYFRINL